jgi:hypothetical protein
VEGRKEILNGKVGSTREGELYKLAEARLVSRKCCMENEEN